MKHKSPKTYVWNDHTTNLLFLDESPTLPTASLLTDALATPESPTPQYHPLSLSNITSEWRGLLKRLGRRRRVVETILTAGQPIRLIADTLIVGFPPYRCFHRELLDMPEYRGCVEEELTRTFGVRLFVATAAHPDSCRLRRNGLFGNRPA